MFQGFLSCELFAKLELLGALDPANVEGRPKSIIPLVMKFSNLVDEEHYEQINKELRELTMQDQPPNAEKFWFNMSQEKCDEEYHISLLSKFMISLLSLLHSSEATENFHFKCALIRSKSLLQNINFTTRNPPKELCDRMQQTKR